MSHEEPETECHSCGYETTNLHRIDPLPFRPGASVQWHCDLCYGTMTGNAALYPGQYPERHVLQTICYVGNVLLTAIEAKK